MSAPDRANDPKRQARINELVNWPENKEFDGPIDYEDAENVEIARGIKRKLKGTN